MDARHVGELLKAVGGQDLVGRRVAEPREAAALDLEGNEPLVAERDEPFGLGLDLGGELLARLEVVHHQDVRVGGRRRLLEAAARHAEDRVEPLDDLRERAGVELDEDLRGVGDRVRRKDDLLRHRPLEPLVDDDVLLLAVRAHLDRAGDGVAGRSGVPVEPARHLELLLADLRRLDPEVGDADLAGRDVDLLRGHVAVEREPRVLPELERHALRRGQVVVDRHRDRDRVALRDRDRQVEVDEEVLEDADRRGRRAERAARRRRERRHAPGGDRVGHRHADRRAPRAVGDQRRVGIERLGEVAAHARSGVATATGFAGARLGGRRGHVDHRLGRGRRVRGNSGLHRHRPGHLVTGLHPAEVPAPLHNSTILEAARAALLPVHVVELAVRVHRRQLHRRRAAKREARVDRPARAGLEVEPLVDGAEVGRALEDEVVPARREVRDPEAAARVRVDVERLPVRDATRGDANAAERLAVLGLHGALDRGATARDRSVRDRRRTGKRTGARRGGGRARLRVDLHVDLVARVVAAVRPERAKRQIPDLLAVEAAVAGERVAPRVFEQVRGRARRGAVARDVADEAVGRRRRLGVEERHLGRDLLRLLEDALAVGGQVLALLGVELFAPELGADVVIGDGARRGQQHARRALALLDLQRDGLAGGEVGKHNLVERELVHLVAGRQQLLLQKHEDLGEAGLLVREREDGLVDDLDADGGRHAAPGGVRDSEVDLRLVARLEALAIRGDLDLEVVGRVDVDQAAVRDRIGVGRDLIGAHLDRAVHLGRQVERELALAVGRVDGARDERLSVAYDVDVDRAALLRGDRIEPDRVADLVDRAVGPEHQALRLRFHVELDLGGRGAPLGVGRGEIERDGVLHGADVEHGDAARVGLERRRNRRALDRRLRGRAVRVGRQHVDAVLQVRQQLAALGNGHDEDRRVRDEHVAALGLDVLGRVLDLGGDRDRRAALLGRAAGEEVGEARRELELPLGVGLARDARQFARLDVERRQRERDLRVRERLAEEVARDDLALDCVARRVVAHLLARGVVRELDLDLKLRQDISIHRDGLLLSRRGVAVAEDRSDMIRAEVHLVGQLEVGRRDAERVGLPALLEDLVALGVLDLERDGRVADRGARRAVERERAKVHRLTGLVEGFVGGQQDAIASDDLDRL